MKPSQMRVRCDQCGNWHDVEYILVENGLFGFMPVIVHICFMCPTYSDTKPCVLDLVFGDSELVPLVEEHPQVKYRKTD